MGTTVRREKEMCIVSCFALCTLQWTHSGREEYCFIGRQLGAVSIVGCLDVLVVLHLENLLLFVHLLLNPTDARVLQGKELSWSVCVCVGGGGGGGGE